MSIAKTDRSNRECPRTSAASPLHSRAHSYYSGQQPCVCPWTIDHRHSRLLLLLHPPSCIPYHPRLLSPHALLHARYPNTTTTTITTTPPPRLQHVLPPWTYLPTYLPARSSASHTRDDSHAHKPASQMYRHRRHSASSSPHLSYTSPHSSRKPYTSI